METITVNGHTLSDFAFNIEELGSNGEGSAWGVMRFKLDGRNFGLTAGNYNIYDASLEYYVGDFVIDEQAGDIDELESIVGVDDWFDDEQLKQRDELWKKLDEIVAKLGEEALNEKEAA